MWQDVVLMIVSFGFSAALIPSVISAHKPARWTCLLTATGLTIMVGVFLTMSLWLTAFANTLSALLWWVLLIQRRK